MAFPAAGVLLDDFNRGDGNVNVGAGEALWSPEGINSGSNALNVVSNLLAASGGNGRELAKSGPDVFRWIDLPVLMASNEGYVFFSARATTGGNWNGYGFIFIRTGASSYVHQFRRYTSGSSTVLGGTASTTALGAGDKIGFSVEGKILKLWRLPSGSEVWEELASREDTTYAGDGYCGIEMTSTTRLDNLFGATVTAGGAGFALPIIS